MERRRSMFQYLKFFFGSRLLVRVCGFAAMDMDRYLYTVLYSFFRGFLLYFFFMTGFYELLCFVTFMIPFFHFGW